MGRCAVHRAPAYHCRDAWGEFDLIARLAAALGDPGAGRDGRRSATTRRCSRPTSSCRPTCLVEDVHVRRATTALGGHRLEGARRRPCPTSPRWARSRSARCRPRARHRLDAGRGGRRSTRASAACAAACGCPVVGRRRLAGARSLMLAVTVFGRAAAPATRAAARGRRRAGRDRQPRRLGGRPARCSRARSRPTAEAGRAGRSATAGRCRALAEGRILARPRPRDARRLRRRRVRRPPAGRGERRARRGRPGRAAAAAGRGAEVAAARAWSRARSRPRAARTTSCWWRCPRRRSPRRRRAADADRPGRGRAGGVRFTGAGADAALAGFDHLQADVAGVRRRKTTVSPTST